MIRKNFIKCGTLGWCLEILWTGLHSFRVRNLKLRGNSSLWMFPIYGCAAFLRPLTHLLRSKNIWKRGTVYMFLIYLGEYISGTLLQRRGICPWDYSQKRWNYQGVIRLDFAPLWFLTGLLFERLLQK